MKFILIATLFVLTGCIMPGSIKQGDCITFYKGQFPRYVEVVVKVDDENYLLSVDSTGDVIGGQLDYMTFRDYSIYRKISCPKTLFFTMYDIKDMRDSGTFEHIKTMMEQTKKDYKLEQ